MNISETYKKYMTPKNLQEHMLRVAALAKIITDNWTGPEIDKLAIIKACAVHDIAKPVNFDTSPAAQAKYNMATEDIQKLDELKKYIADNFGTDEHKAAADMAREMKLGDKAIEILDQMEWEYTARLLGENNFEPLITLYCDMRISPNGILPLEKRYGDLKSRRGVSFDQHLKDAKVLEQLLQKNTKKDLNSISESDLNFLFQDLQNLEI